MTGMTNSVRDFGQTRNEAGFISIWRPFVKTKKALAKGIAPNHSYD